MFFWFDKTLPGRKDAMWTHIITFQPRWLHVRSCQNASHPRVMANQLFTLITSVWEQAVVTWDAVRAVVWLDVLAAIQGLLAVVAVETVGHGSSLERHKHSRWQFKGGLHTQRGRIFSAIIYSVNTRWMINRASGNKWERKDEAKERDQNPWFWMLCNQRKPEAGGGNSQGSRRCAFSQ